jgi:hypothetical protein
LFDRFSAARVSGFVRFFRGMAHGMRPLTWLSVQPQRDACTLVRQRHFAICAAALLSRRAENRVGTLEIAYGAAGQETRRA